MRKRCRAIIVVLIATLLTGVVWACLRVRPPVLYRVTLLPSLGGDFTTADALNDRGQMAGTSSVPGGASHLFFWDRKEGMRDLGSVWWVAGINNKEQIAGIMEDPNGSLRAFVASPDGTRRLLGTLGGSRSTAAAINDQGQVVGGASTDADVRHAFIWDQTHGMQDLGPPGADDSIAVAISERGQVIVNWPQQKIFFWDPNAGSLPIYRHTPGLLFSVASINNRGQIAHASRSLAGGSKLRISNDGVRWRTLLELDGDIHKVWLNDANQVLVAKRLPPSQNRLLSRFFSGTPARSYVWDPCKGLIPLDGHVPRGMRMWLEVRDLNNDGSIVGTLRSSNSSRAVLLEPIPERWGRRAGGQR